MLFKEFRVPHLFIANASVLALFSTGRTTGNEVSDPDARIEQSFEYFPYSGVVVEAGAGLCSVVPVFEGCALPYATLCQHLGSCLKLSMLILSLSLDSPFYFYEPF